MTSTAKKTLLLVFINVLVSVYHAFSAEIWRYSTKEGDGTLFSTQNLIMLEYFGGKSEVDWCYPNECQLKNKSSSRATLQCPKSGLHAVGPTTNSPDNQGIRYIEVVNDPFYYEWYLAYNRQSKNETHEEFRLWIVDPKHVSGSEHNRTASAPSKISRRLTEVFYQLGQKPSLKAKRTYRFTLQGDWMVYNRSFIVSEGYWQFVTSSVRHYDTTIWIDGQSVALLDRFIRKSSLQLMKTKFNLPPNADEQQVVITGGNSAQASMIFQDPCSPHIAILISSKCFLTQDNFASVKEVKVPAGLLAQSEILVKSAAFSADNIILLLESGKILVFNETTQTWSQPSGVSLERFIGLSSQKKCFEGVEKQMMKGALFAWTNQVELNVVHISRDSGLSFHNISIPAISGFHNISIKHIEIHCLVPAATFLLHCTNVENQQKGFFLQYNLAEDAWEKYEVSCCLDSPVSFFFNPPSTQFVFVWSEKSLAFGRVNETGSSFKVKRQENETEFELDSNETIVSVTAGGNGDFVVVSSSSRMFYGRAYLGHLVEIHSGEDISSSWTIMFDMLGSLLLIYIEGFGARQRKLPLKNEVLSAVYPQTSCSYLRFTTSITPELHFMDKGDEIKIWAELIYHRSTPNHIKLEISNSDMLQISTEDSIQHYHGIVTQNTTFTFKYELRNGSSNLKGPYKSASLSIQLNPAVAELTCQNNNQALHVNVGCPPAKSIVIRNCTEASDEDPLPLLSQVENQDGAVPCQLTAAMDENFKLIVDLYEGGRFVQEVHDDYIVQEETGRIDFGYIATMSEVGCLQEAQRWAKMAINNSGDLMAAWTQSNYRSCFMSDVTQNDRSFDGNLPYEILNSTGLSQLLFKGLGLFHFQLRIVATHLSFCELSTRFSVDVTESKGKDYLPQLVSIIVVTLGSAVLLYLSYAHYTKQTLDRHQENVEEQQRLQELKSLSSSFKEGFDTVVRTHPLSTVNTVRRFTGTAMLMKNQIPEEFLHFNPSTFEGSSNVSLQSKKSSHKHIHDG